MAVCLAAILAEAALLLYFTVRLYIVHRRAGEYARTACKRYMRAKICLLPTLVAMFCTGFISCLYAQLGMQDDMWLTLYLCGFGVMVLVFAGVVVYILYDVQRFVKYGVTVDARVTGKSVRFGRNVVQLEYEVKGHSRPVQMVLPKCIEVPPDTEPLPVTYLKTMPFIVRPADNRAVERRELYEILFMTVCLLITLFIVILEIVT